MRRVTLAGIALAALACAAIAAAAGRQDGAVIRNSGSTNTAGYIIKLWADGHAEATLQGSQGHAKPFTVDPAVAKHFFEDVKAARANPGTPGRCMKSASFGTTTTVLWHGWLSSDLQCPPFTAPVHALQADVVAVQAAGQLGEPPHRLRLPVEPRMIPSTAPEVSPT